MTGPKARAQTVVKHLWAAATNLELLGDSLTNDEAEMIEWCYQHADVLRDLASEILPEKTSTSDNIVLFRASGGKPDLPPDRPRSRG